MKINNINTNLSFGRVIQIKSDSQNQTSTDKTDKSTYEICKILNSERTHKYSNQQAQSIRDFFKSILDDYNGQNGILMRKNDSGDIVLISGKEAKKISRIEKKFSEPQKSSLVNLIIRTSLPNKKYGKTYSNLEFKTGHKSKSDFSIFNQIIYSTADLTYGHKSDGFIHEAAPEESNTIYKIEYEEKVLGI